MRTLRSSLLLCLWVLVGCSSTEAEILEEYTEGVPLLEARREDFVNLDANSIILLDAVRNANGNTVRISEESHNSFELDLALYADSIRVAVSANRNSEGLISKVLWNEVVVSNENAAVLVKTESYTVGNVCNLPSTVRFMMANSYITSLSMSSGVLEIERINLDDFVEMSGMYTVSRRFVEDLVLNRILVGYQVMEFVVTDNSIYAVMVGRGYYDTPFLIWYDGVHLTIAGNFFL